MKVLITTLGTRGDVQPFVALARGLLAAGHEVVLAAPQRFAGFYFTVWMVTPSSTLAGSRPVDLLDRRSTALFPALEAFSRG